MSCAVLMRAKYRLSSVSASTSPSLMVLPTMMPNSVPSSATFRMRFLSVSNHSKAIGTFSLPSPYCWLMMLPVISLAIIRAPSSQSCRTGCPVPRVFAIPAPRECRRFADCPGANGMR